MFQDALYYNQYVSVGLKASIHKAVPSFVEIEWLFVGKFHILSTLTVN